MRNRDSIKDGDKVLVFFSKETIKKFKENAKAKYEDPERWNKFISIHNTLCTAVIKPPNIFGMIQDILYIKEIQQSVHNKHITKMTPVSIAQWRIENENLR